MDDKTSNKMLTLARANRHICSLSTLTTETASELYILRLDGHTLGVDGSQVGVFKEPDQVSFRRFLQGTDGAALETQVGLEVLGNLTHKTLEGQLADKQLSALLITTDFSQSNSSWSVTVWLLDSSGCWGRLTGGLGGELLTRGLSTGGLTGCLLCSCHFSLFSSLDTVFRKVGIFSRSLRISPFIQKFEEG